MKKYILSCLCLILSNTTIAQVNLSIDKFKSPNDYYVAFNSGSGTINSSTNNSDYISGNSSMQINYTFNSGEGYFFTAIMNYGTITKDWSFYPDRFVLRHKGGNTTTIIKIRLWEDINMNGLYDGEDEVYTSSGIATGQSAWTESDFLIEEFTKVTGNGNNALDLNRIRAWDIAVENSNSTSTSGQILFDEFIFKSSYIPPSSGTAKLTGSFTQLWNGAGCNCGNWNLENWRNEFQKMKEVCMNTYIIQYSVYDNFAWYNADQSLNFIQYREDALSKIFQAAEEKDMKIYLGLFFDESWNNSSKDNPSTYSNLLTKHKAVIDDLWDKFGSKAAFAGWYIPQEINDYEWNNTTEKTLLFNWLKEVSDYASSKDNTKEVMIAPFFNLWKPADVVKAWYNELFQTTPNITQVFPQDGVGITLKDVRYHVPLYYAKIKEAAQSNGVKFGATVESFHQTSGWPINEGSFAATSTSINSLKSQIWEAALHSPEEIIQFEWSYMQPGLNSSSTQLFNDYKDYATCLITGNHSNSKAIYKEPIIYPNPATYEVHIIGETEGIKILSATGILINEVPPSDKLDVSKLENGVYYLEIYQIGNEKKIEKLIICK
ncbi:MAG TPA: DUF4434 domain-containing protein [Cytophagaceae bacterium]